MATNEFEITALRLNQPIGEFFSAVMPACLLRELAEPEPRKIIDPETETRTGIQRILSETRLREIADFLRTADAAVPNSIILSLNTKSIISGPTPIAGASGLFHFSINREKNVFSVIDGQHRLYGFDDQTCKSFDLLVTIFLDLADEEKAFIFSTINSTQAKVNKSLVYDLFDLATTRSPQRTAHIVAKSMNSDSESPLFRRIKLLGLNPRFDDAVLYKGSISQGTFVSRLLPLLSANPAGDRDILKKGGDLSADHNDLSAGRIFRSFFVENADDAILKVLMSYFGAIATHFSAEWNSDSCPLARTIGFGALIRLLIPLFIEGIHKQDVSFEFFSKRFEDMRKAYDKSGLKMDFDTYPAAGNGETKLAYALAGWAGVSLDPKVATAKSSAPL